MRGRSDETPHYPHSVELRTLTQTGLAGACLAVVGLAAALLAGARACRFAALRGDEELGPAVAAAALGGFAYWAVHGSVDWFWEFAGLGAPAFALLGLACALAPSTRMPAGRIEHEAPTTSRKPGWARLRGGVTADRRLASRRLCLIAALVTGLAAAISLGAPWLSQLQVQSAARVWSTAPAEAYGRLDRAASLNPLSDTAYLVAGSIAVRLGELARADHEFSLALERTPGDPYATLERGAIASTQGNRRRALGLLTAAARLNPRDPLTRQALLLVREGRRVSVEALNRSILLRAQQLA
jgi:tetratricopeptide (TPR) repeat protein